jgi:hypothetical protein
MYGLPEMFDASFFVGRTLQNVVFSQCMVELIFDGKVAIGIQSSYELQIADGTGYVKRNRVEEPIHSSRLMQLLGARVASVRAERDGTLTLDFEHGSVFRCFDDSPNYESYSIGHGEEETYV